MKISISSSSPAWDRDAFKDQLTYVQEAERMGADTVWTVEGWGQDAVTPLAYLAARTKTIKLGTAIMQITARAPAMTAMTAMTLSSLSEKIDQTELEAILKLPVLLERYLFIIFPL